MAAYAEVKSIRLARCKVRAAGKVIAETRSLEREAFYLSEVEGLALI